MVLMQYGRGSTHSSYCIIAGI